MTPTPDRVWCVPAPPVTGITGEGVCGRITSSRKPRSVMPGITEVYGAAGHLADTGAAEREPPGEPAADQTRAPVLLGLRLTGWGREAGGRRRRGPGTPAVAGGRRRWRARRRQARTHRERGRRRSPGRASAGATRRP